MKVKSESSNDVEFPLTFAFVMLTFQKGDYKTRQKPKDNKVSETYQNVVLFEIFGGKGQSNTLKQPNNLKLEL